MNKKWRAFAFFFFAGLILVLGVYVGFIRHGAKKTDSANARENFEDSLRQLRSKTSTPVRKAYIDANVQEIAKKNFG